MRVKAPHRRVLHRPRGAGAAQRARQRPPDDPRASATRPGATLSDVEMGVCHQRVAESYAKPGDLVIGADSHTCTAGALGAFATGMGSHRRRHRHGDRADLAARARDVSHRGRRARSPTASTAKDLILTLIGRLGADGATYKALEFGGPAIDALPMHERLTLTNMAVEAGAKAGLVASDETTRAFLAAQGREADWRPLGARPGRRLRALAVVPRPTSSCRWSRRRTRSTTCSRPPSSPAPRSTRCSSAPAPTAASTTCARRRACCAAAAARRAPA